jgi:hypothetical protein
MQVFLVHCVLWLQNAHDVLALKGMKGLNVKERYMIFD